MTEDDEVSLNLIEEARAKNNGNWMNIIRLALKHAPDETRAILRSIKNTDLDISFYTSRIANADSETQDRPRSSPVYRR